MSTNTSTNNNTMSTDFKSKSKKVEKTGKSKKSEIIESIDLLDSVEITKSVEKSKKDKKLKIIEPSEKNNSIIPNISEQTIIEQSDFAQLSAQKIVYSQSTIGISSFDLSVPGKKLFNEANLIMTKGIKYSLIGPNGSGKSTLLKTLVSLRNGNSNKYTMQIDTVYVEQEFEANNTSTPLDIVLNSNYKQNKFQKEVERLELLFESSEYTEEEFEALQEKYVEMTDFISSVNPEKEKSIVIKILIGLGFTESDLSRSFEEFSGGWRMRISLARALYLEPDLLLLDEPTNHLDFEAIIWLSDYLQTYKKTVIIVSHNIGFINDVCDWTLAIESQKLSMYKGSYDLYKKQFAIKQQEAMKAYDTWNNKLKDLRKKSDKKKIEEHLKNAITRPPKEFDGDLNFGNPLPLKGNIIEINNVTFEYNTANPILKNVTIGINFGERIVLVGPNGCGKSTLVKLMTQEITPTLGEIKFHHHINIGSYNQHFEAQLPLDKTPIEHLSFYITDNFIGNGGIEQSIRSFLGRVRLEGYAHKKLIGELSGGQKARIALIQLIFLQPNCLILDEPTNHLDIETVEALIDSLVDYTGTVVVITHDHNLINKINAQVMMVDPSIKTINTKINSYDTYCEYVLANINN